MLKPLAKLKKEKKYAQINMVDGNVIPGFVTEVDMDSFTMSVLEEQDSGDCIVMEISFRPEEVESIVHDTSHHAKPEDWAAIEWVRDNIVYKTSQKPKKKKQTVTKKAAKKPNDTLTTDSQP